MLQLTPTVDGTADYLDTDSDGDALLDSAESGLGTPTDATYEDPDGSVTTTSASLDNQVGDTSEVGFRESLPPTVDTAFAKRHHAKLDWYW